MPGDCQFAGFSFLGDRPPAGRDLLRRAVTPTGPRARSCRDAGPIARGILPEESLRISVDVAMPFIPSVDLWRRARGRSAKSPLGRAEASLRSVLGRFPRWARLTMQDDVSRAVEGRGRPSRPSCAIVQLGQAWKKALAEGDSLAFGNKDEPKGRNYVAPDDPPVLTDCMLRTERRSLGGGAHTSGWAVSDGCCELPVLPAVRQDDHRFRGGRACRDRPPRPLPSSHERHKGTSSIRLVVFDANR